MPDQGEVTQVLLQARAGDRAAIDRLIPLVYEELRRVAHNRLQVEPAGHTLNTTGLVHEAYLRLVDQTRVEWRDRAHFFSVASMAMRRILVDYARKHRAAKRDGDRLPLPLDSVDVPAANRSDILIELDDALKRLSALNQRLCRVVECRFFGGLTETDTAEALGVTTRTIRRDWAKAKALLYVHLAGE